MNYEAKTKKELIKLCREKGVKGYSNKKKKEIITILQSFINPMNIPNSTINKKKIKVKKETCHKSYENKIHRLNYIGSKFQLLDWLVDNIKKQTGWTTFQNKIIADLFSGTGIVSYNFRLLNATVISNDAELYSAIISHAFVCSTYTEKCAKIIQELNDNKEYLEGYITKNYSPYNNCERMFFTVDNAKRIDYIRTRLEEIKTTLTENEYKFILASLLLSSDAVSNVPAVYGCYLKKFKSKALKTFELRPIHTNTSEPLPTSRVTHSDILSNTLLSGIVANAVYLDPPYNERQYSKNYFPLNMIALNPSEQESEKPLKGKTGIPESCFISPFCKKGKTVEEAFEKIFKTIKTEWFFVSYNSESLISKDKMIEIMENYGHVEVVERDYKRFKSFEYNQDVAIKEYLFCIRTLE